ncbi:unnamed protein product [Ambrosiozyma monospora]|uniref:DNA 3'-5' helicase n=1 Tax=Ambrosiozyma monospora TaxID=43982 RepID=A0A9W7DFS4_AMBMO|nr:unnamed protein product [Ambrosiozyma monospora]
MDEPQVQDIDQEVEVDCTKLQEQAILHDFTTPNSLLNIVAGPGSGKTRTLSNRIAYILSKGVQPNEILVLSLTNRSVSDIKFKLQNVVGEEMAKLVDIMTFHSFASLVVNEKYENDWYLLEEDQLRKLNELVSTSNTKNKKQYSHSLFKTLLKQIRSFNGTEEEYCHSDIYLKYKLPFSVYENIKYLVGSNNVFTYDDLLSECHQILTTEEEATKPEFISNYKVIIVDEIQDIYPALCNIVLDLSLDKHLTIAGDPNQSIYKFLGAEYSKNWGRILPEFEKAETITLNESFRLTPELQRFSNSMLKGSKPKTTTKSNFSSCVKSSVSLEPVRISFNSQVEEYEFIYNEIKRMVNLSSNQIKYSDIAILAFANQDVDSCYRFFEEKQSDTMGLKRLNSTPRWLNTDISLILQYMKILVDPTQSLALLTTLSMLKGVGLTTVNSINSAAVELNVSVWDYIMNHDLKTSKSISKIILNYRDVIEDCRESMDANDPNSIMVALLTLANKYGLKQRLNKKKLNELQLKEYEEFLTSIWMTLKKISNFKPADQTLLQFYLHNYNTELLMNSKLKGSLNLASDEDTIPNTDTGDNVNINDYESEVKFSTIHTAKGLEFPIVFLLSSNNDNLFLPERKRALYVAVTRATTLLYFNKLNNHFVSEIDNLVGKGKQMKNGNSNENVDLAPVMSSKPPEFNEESMKRMLDVMGRSGNGLGFGFGLAGQVRGFSTLVSKIMGKRFI